jgi:hypothetical protein
MKMFKKIVEIYRRMMHRWRMKKQLAKLRKNDPFIY